MHLLVESKVGFTDDDPSKAGTAHSPAVLGNSEEICNLVDSYYVDTLAIAINAANKESLVKSSLKCKMNGITLYDMPDLDEELSSKVPIGQVDDLWFLKSTISGVRVNFYNRKGKRVVDIICSLLVLILGLLVFAVTTIAIKLGSNGPIFYRQKRIGQNGREFDMIKFRSMYIGSEPDGAVWASKNDSRVTKVGRIIRKLRIDEMPQAWNVLKGEMSFIGPRPERPAFVEKFREKIPYYSLRHSVKPGITGWGQVNFNYGDSEEAALEKLSYELFYIKNLSPVLDLHILLKTIKVVLYGNGAR